MITHLMINKDIGSAAVFGFGWVGRVALKIQGHSGVVIGVEVGAKCPARSWGEEY